MGDPRTKPESEGVGEPSWAGPTGSAALVVEAPHLVRIVMRGHIDAKTGISLAAALDRHIKSTARCHTYWDLEAMDTYESTVRVECTRVLLENPSRTGSIVALARSQVVKMGVAVANLALDNKVLMFAERAPFEKALQRELTLSS